MSKLELGVDKRVKFGMIIEWVEGGFVYSSTYMAEQLLDILFYPLPQPIYLNKLPPQ